MVHIILDRDTALLQMAEVVAMRGTCSRLQVGVVFSKEGRVISTGYNGAPAGMPHCSHFEWDGKGTVPEWLRTLPYQYTQQLDELNPGNIYWDGGTLTMGMTPPGCTVSEHAERNAIAFAARFGVALDGSEMHITHMPCLDCARSIINAGVTKVTYLRSYRKTEGVKLLRDAGIRVVDPLDRI